jgi:anti-sigma factor RsiW
MSCAFSEKLELYVDGALEAAARAELESHLAGCAECPAEVARLRRLDELLGALPESEPSARFEATFLRRLRAEAVPRASLRERLFGGWRGFALAAAAAGAAAVVAVGVWSGRAPEPETERPPTAVLQNLDLLKNLDVLANLEVLEGVTAEELEAVAEIPEVGG